MVGPSLTMTMRHRAMTVGVSCPDDSGAPTIAVP